MLDMNMYMYIFRTMLPYYRDRSFYIQGLWVWVKKHFSNFCVMHTKVKTKSLLNGEINKYSGS